jgi:hypothetical protein
MKQTITELSTLLIDINQWQMGLVTMTNHVTEVIKTSKLYLNLLNTPNVRLVII